MTGHCILMNKRNSLSEGCFLAFFSKAFENRSPPTTFYKCNEISRIPYRFTISTQGRTSGAYHCTDDDREKLPTHQEREFMVKKKRIKKKRR